MCAYCVDVISAIILQHCDADYIACKLKQDKALRLTATPTQVSVVWLSLCGWVVISFI